MADEERQIFLDLGIAHIGTVHELGLPSAIFTDFEHVPHYLNIRPSSVHCLRSRSTCWDFLPMTKVLYINIITYQAFVKRNIVLV